MAQEILDDGACKARGFLGFAATGALTDLRAIGITAAVRMGAGRVRMTLLEPIGADEFYAQATASGESDTGLSIERIDDSTVELRAFNTAGVAAERACWFDVYRLGVDQCGLVAEAAP